MLRSVSFWGCLLLVVRKGACLLVERISLVNAGRVFSDKWALRGIETSLQPSQVYAVLGANGAGKSTLLRLMAGWLPLSEGRILFDESPMRPTATHLRRKVMLLEEHTVSKNGTRSKPTETLCSTINDYQADRPNLEQEIADWYDRLDVTSVYNKDERSMSKGQAYKIKLIGLFVVAPPVWLLDEPFSAGLDADESIVEELMRQWYLSMAKERLPQIVTPVIESFRSIYKVAPARITVKHMRSRWGSCSSRKAVSLNSKLIMTPERCIEYVMVHELCHLIHFNHSENFYSLLAEILPDWKERKKELRSFSLYGY